MVDLDRAKELLLVGTAVAGRESLPSDEAHRGVSGGVRSLKTLSHVC